MKLKHNYYWIKLRNNDITIGCYEDTSFYPWIIVGSDEIFTEAEVTVIEEIGSEPHNKEE